MLGGVARQTKHGGQNRLHLNLSHAQADKIKEKLTNASLFFTRNSNRCGAVKFDRTLETHFGQDF